MYLATKAIINEEEVKRYNNLSREEKIWESLSNMKVERRLSHERQEAAENGYTLINYQSSIPSVHPRFSQKNVFVYTFVERQMAASNQFYKRTYQEVGYDDFMTISYKKFDERLYQETTKERIEALKKSGLPFETFKEKKELAIIEEHLLPIQKNQELNYRRNLTPTIIFEKKNIYKGYLL